MEEYKEIKFDLNIESEEKIKELIQKIVNDTANDDRYFDEGVKAIGMLFFGLITAGRLGIAIRDFKIKPNKNNHDHMH